MGSLVVPGVHKNRTRGVMGPGLRPGRRVWAFAPIPYFFAGAILSAGLAASGAGAGVLAA